MAQTIAQALRVIADGLAGVYVNAETLYTIVARLEAGACGSDPMPPGGVATMDTGPSGPGTGGGGGTGGGTGG